MEVDTHVVTAADLTQDVGLGGVGGSAAAEDASRPSFPEITALEAEVSLKPHLALR